MSPELLRACEMRAHVRMLVFVCVSFSLCIFMHLSVCVGLCKLSLISADALMALKDIKRNMAEMLICMFWLIIRTHGYCSLGHYRNRSNDCCSEPTDWTRCNSPGIDVCARLPLSPSSKIAYRLKLGNKRHVLR